MKQVIFALAFCGSLASASPVCSGKKLWVETEGSLMMALRSNACHFWAWSAQNSSSRLPQEALKFTGLVAGDAHHENFFHVFAGGERVYVLNDMDDSGQAPLLLDILKFAGVSRSVIRSQKELSIESILTAYRDGVAGRPWAGGIPKLLEKDCSVKLDQLNADYADKIKGDTTDGLFDSKEGMVTWSQMSGTDRARFSELEAKFFQGSLPAGYQISDRAIYTKAGGGSGGEPRYWYYLKKSKTEREIVEFKSIAEPAVAAITKQPFSGRERVTKVADVYWDKGLPQGFAIVGNTSQAFWMRPRLPGYIDFNAKVFRDDPKSFAELTRFIAYHLGHWHGKQARGRAYADYLDANAETLVRTSEGFIGDYLKVAESQTKH